MGTVDQGWHPGSLRHLLLSEPDKSQEPDRNSIRSTSEAVAEVRP